MFHNNRHAKRPDRATQIARSSSCEKSAGKTAARRSVSSGEFFRTVSGRTVRFPSAATAAAGPFTPKNPYVMICARLGKTPFVREQTIENKEMPDTCEEATRQVIVCVYIIIQRIYGVSRVLFVLPIRCRVNVHLNVRSSGKRNSYGKFRRIFRAMTGAHHNNLQIKIAGESPPREFATVGTTCIYRT